MQSKQRLHAKPNLLDGSPMIAISPAWEGLRLIVNNCQDNSIKLQAISNYKGKL